jgi:hypothetical protein
MPTIDYRLFFNDAPAKQDQLDMVDSIEIEQDVDMAWEARLEIPLCSSDSGKWAKEDDKILADFGRVRVEVKIGKDSFVPLIDGPIVGFDNNMSSEPGQSTLNVRVQDDSVLLNRVEKIDSFKDKTDDQIAKRVFQSIPEIASVKTDPVSPPDAKLPLVEVQHGTAMQILRALAKRQNMHAYVLPGSKPGQSIGVFKKYPTTKDGLPDMILLGADRNIGRFEVKNRATQAGKTVGYAVSITDKKVVKKTSSFKRLDLLGPDQAVKSDQDAGTYLLPPDLVDSVDLDSAVQAKTDATSYQFEASGFLYTECYRKVLTPYRLVTATGVNGRLSGDYVVIGVTHTLNRETYKQTFKLLRNARSAGAGASTGPLDKVF